MISLYKRRRIWWMRGTLNHQTVRPRSCDTTLRPVAEAIKQRLELEVLAGQRQITWPNFRTEFLAHIVPRVKPSTARQYEFVLQRFGRFLADRPPRQLTAISPGEIAGYTTDRRRDRHPTRGGELGREGLKNDLRILHRVFAYALEAGYLKHNPIPYAGLKSHPRETPPFTRLEISQMLDACKNRKPTPGLPPPLDLTPIILFFLYTGFRISDVIHCRKQDVDLANRRIVRRTRKRDTTVTIPLHPELAEALRAHLAEHRSCAHGTSPYLFSTASGRPILNLAAYLARLWKSAGIEHAHAHRFRDTFAVMLLEQGASLYDVARLLGISVAVCEIHYAPYARELQDRATRLLENLRVGD